MMRPFALLILLCTAAPAVAQVPGQLPGPTPREVQALVRSPVEVADSLFLDEWEPGAALELLEVYLQGRPNDAEAHWRATRAALVLALSQTEREERRRLLRLGEALGDSAVAVAPDNIDVLSWAAAAKGRLTIEIGGRRSKVRRGQEVWDMAHRVLEMDPDHPFAHDILGKLNQEVRKLGSFKRFMARLLMDSDLLEQSTWESSEEHLRAAVAADPTVLLFYLDLGETYLLQGKEEEARRTFEAGLEVPDLYPIDPGFRIRIRQHLTELNR